MTPEEFHQSQISDHNRTKEPVSKSEKWRVRFNTIDGMFSHINITRKGNPLCREEVNEWADMKAEFEDGLSSVDSIEAL